MSLSAHDLTTALRERGLLGQDDTTPAEGDAPPAHERPLAIGLLLGASGWVAGLFMLGFVAMLFHPDEPVTAAISGAVLLAAAWGLFKVDGDGTQVFVAQLGLTFSIAGQCLMLFALADDSRGIAGVSAAALVLQAALAWLMPNRLHRTLSTLFALIAWALLVRFGLFGEPDFWRSSSDAQAHISVAAALGAWLLAWLPIVALLGWLIRSEAQWMASRRQALLRPIISGLIVGLALATLASHPLESFRLFGGDTPNTGGLALWPLLSAFGALAALAAAFALRQRGLMALCIVAALLHLSNFYYALGTTLLVKSLLMLAMGAAALLAARALRTKEQA